MVVDHGYDLISGVESTARVVFLLAISAGDGTKMGEGDYVMNHSRRPFLPAATVRPGLDYTFALTHTTYFKYTVTRKETTSPTMSRYLSNIHEFEHPTVMLINTSRRDAIT